MGSDALAEIVAAMLREWRDDGTFFRPAVRLEAESVALARDILAALRARGALREEPPK